MTSIRWPSRSTASTRCSYPLVVAAKPPGNNPSILDNAGLPKTHSIGRFAGETKKDNSDLYPRNVVVIFGKIEYWDVFGHPRKTIFCSQRSAGPEQPFGRCPIYNDME